MGNCYYNGNGVKKDYAKAVEWYRKAAEKGDAGGQYSLGYSYYSGEGVDQDYAKAMVWYQKSAAQGNAGAMCNIGWLYENGNGVTQSMTKAIEYYKKAANAGNSIAQCNLGNIYYYGNGVPANKTVGLQWYKKAAEQGNEKAKEALEKIEKENADAAKRAQFNKRLGYNTANTSITKLVSVGRNINAVIDYINEYYVGGYDYFINLYQDWGGGTKNYKLYRTYSGSGSSRRGNYWATIYTSNGRITSVTWK